MVDAPENGKGKVKKNAAHAMQTADATSTRRFVRSASGFARSTKTIATSDTDSTRYITVISGMPSAGIARCVEQ